MGIAQIHDEQYSVGTWLICREMIEQYHVPELDLVLLPWSCKFIVFSFSKCQLSKRHQSLLF